MLVNKKYKAEKAGVGMAIRVTLPSGKSYLLDESLSWSWRENAEKMHLAYRILRDLFGKKVATKLYSPFFHDVVSKFENGQMWEIDGRDVVKKYAEYLKEYELDMIVSAIRSLK